MSRFIERERERIKRAPTEVWNGYIERYRTLNGDELHINYQQGALLNEIYGEYGQPAIERLAFEESLDTNGLIALMRFNNLFEVDDLKPELSLTHHTEIATHYNPGLEGGRTPVEWLNLVAETKWKPKELGNFLNWYYDAKGTVYDNFWKLYSTGQLGSALSKDGEVSFFMGYEIHPELIAQWQEEIEEEEKKAREGEEERKATIRKRGAVVEKEKVPVTYLVTATWEVKAVDKDDAYSKLKERLGEKASAILETANTIHFIRREREK